MLEQRIQAVATRPRVTPHEAVFPRSDYIYTVVPTSLKYMLDKDGTVIEESDNGGDAAVLYVYEADAYYKRASQAPFDDTQDPDKPIFTKDSVDGVYKAASAIRLVSPARLTISEDVAAVNRGAYFEVINVTDKQPAPWTLVPKLTPGSYRIYIPDGSLILYLISAEHESSPSHTVSGTSTAHVAEPKHIVDVGRGKVTIDPPADPFGADWYTVELYAGDVYVVIEEGLVKITNSPSEYSSRIACIVGAESGNIEQIANSTITLLVEEDSPDAPLPDTGEDDIDGCSDAFPGEPSGGGGSGATQDIFPDQGENPNSDNRNDFPGKGNKCW